MNDITTRLVGDTGPFADPDAVTDGAQLVGPQIKKRSGNPEALAEYRRKVASGEIIPKPRTPKAPPRNKDGRVRDSQRSRLYKAEEVLGQKDLNEVGSIADCQAWVDRLCGERWFQSRWGRREIEVRFKSYGSATGYTNSHICLPPWSRNPRVMLHEIAHVLTPSRYAAHGPEFAAMFVTLVELELGKEAARKLRDSFVANKVRYRSGMAAVPKAGTRQVVTKTAWVATERAAAARRQKELVWSKEKRALAAEVIRALVAEGKFGEAGSKPRARALAVAKTVAG